MNEPSESQRKEAIALLSKLQRGYVQEMLSDERYFKLFNKADTWVKQCIQDDGEAPHVFFLWGRTRSDDDPKWNVQPIMFADWPPEGMSKYEAMQAIGVMFADKHPDDMLMEAIHVSEGWIAEYPQGVKTSGPYMPEGVPTPSERPDRIEVLMVSATSMDQRVSYRNTEIKRDNDGKFAEWGRVWESLYDPKAKATDPRDKADWLALNVFMGYFSAKKKP